jgi:hypothetical protein
VHDAAVTHGHLAAELERFRGMIAELSRSLPDDREFWPAYAEQANALEARCPLEHKDCVRESILRTIAVIREGRAAAV